MTRDDSKMDKLLDKLKKIKAHAESADKIGNEAEAEAFAAMLQRLMLRHKIDMTDLDFEVEDAKEQVTRGNIDWKDIKVRKSRVAWIERLAGIVARAYFCRILVHPGSSRLTLVGRESDRLIAEYIIITLVRLAEKLAKKERDKVYRQNRMRASGFQAAFLKAFTIRIAERLEDERRTAETSSSTALVRINRAEADVNEYMKSFTKKAAIVRGSRRDFNAEGMRKGRAVADSMNLRGNAVESGSSRATGRIRG